MQKYGFALTQVKPKCYGDTNGDGVISIMDATMIQKHIAMISEIENDRIECADTNRDTVVSIIDATLIQMFIAELIPSL